MLSGPRANFSRRPFTKDLISARVYPSQVTTEAKAHQKVFAVILAKFSLITSDVQRAVQVRRTLQLTGTHPALASTTSTR